MEEQGKGSFEGALHNLLRSIKNERDKTSNSEVRLLCAKLLREWDSIRGNDWYYPLDK